MDEIDDVELKMATGIMVCVSYVSSTGPSDRVVLGLVQDHALGTTQKSEYDKYLQKIHKKSESGQKILNHSEFVRISYFNLLMCNQPNSLKFMKGK